MFLNTFPLDLRLPSFAFLLVYEYFFTVNQITVHNLLQLAYFREMIWPLLVDLLSDVALIEL